MNIYDIGFTSHIYPGLRLLLQRATDEWFDNRDSQPSSRAC